MRRYGPYSGSQPNAITLVNSSARAPDRQGLAASVRAQHAPVPHSPFPYLLPSVTCNQPVNLISPAKHIILLDVRLLPFRVSNPVVDFWGYGFLGELRKGRNDGAVGGGWEIASEDALEREVAGEGITQGGRSEDKARVSCSGLQGVLLRGRGW